MDWNDVRHFLALARSGSARDAGASLGVSHSTVARRVEALESELSVRLFDRNRDGYCLTDAGRLMLPGAERVEREMSALERDLVGQDERLAGSVAITCCDPYVAAIVMGELKTFCDAHPHIELSLTVDSRPFDLAKREADIAIRALGVGAQPPDYLIGSIVAPLWIASYVARRHASRLDPEQAGAAPRWVAFDDRKQFEMMVAQSSYPHLPSWGSVSSLQLMAQAAREGFGLAMLPTYAGDHEPDLRRLDRADVRHMADLWLLTHPDLRDNARIRATRASIARAFDIHAAQFLGEPWHSDAPGCPEIAPSGGSEPNL